MRRQLNGPTTVTLLLPALLVFLPGLLTLRYDLVYDDLVAVKGSLELIRQDPLQLILSFRRPLKAFSFALDEWLFTGAPWGFHLQSVLWASLNATLVAVLAFLITNRQRTSLAAGILFAVHPIHVESIANVANRKDLLAFAFGVAAIAAIHPCLRSGRMPRPWRLAFAAVMLLLCVLSKEVVAAGVIGVLAVLPMVSSRASPVKNRTATASTDQAGSRIPKTAVLISGLMLMGGLLLAWFYLPAMTTLYSAPRLDSLSGGQIQDPSDWLVRSFAGVARSASLLSLPVGMSADHPVPGGGWPGVLAALIGVLLLLGTFVLGVRLAPREPLLAAGLIWFLPSMLPVMNLLPLSQFFVAERYLYFPSLGVALIGAALLDYLCKPTGRQNSHSTPFSWLGSLVAITAVSLVASVYQSETWRNSHTLWTATVLANPDSYRAHATLGVLYNKSKMYAAAEQEFQKALELGPDHFRGKALCAVGAARAMQGQTQPALTALSQGLELRPWDAECRANKGMALLGLGDEENALAELQRAVASAPLQLMLREMLIQAYNRLGRSCDAVPICREISEQPDAIEFSPVVAAYCTEAQERCPNGKPSHQD